ncbi:MAG: hypothetical protein ACFCVK_00960 [Acidimicrobiales bacterium]
MRFGVFDHRERRSDDLHQLYEERLNYLERVDEAGFWAFFNSEDHLTPLHVAPCPAVIMAAAAQRTSRVAAFAEGSTADLLVASVTWGDPTADESLRSLDLCVEHAMSPLVAS